MFKARTRSVTGKSITHDIEKQVNDRARAAAGNSSSNLFGAFFA